MPAADLYFFKESPPCNSIVLLAHTLGVELNLIPIDFEKNEHLTPEFLKLNPEHTVPTLNDNGFSVWESRAILIYLFEKYGKAKDAALYPSDPEKRARVNQRLFFDLGTFYDSINYYYDQVFDKKPADPAKLAKVDEAFKVLDQYLGEQTYVAGNELTLADYTIATSTKAFEGTGYDYTRYPNVARWFKLIQTVDGWEKVAANMEGVKNYFVDL